MEKVNELVEELIKQCSEENIAVSIATTAANGKTSAHMSGDFPGVLANSAAIHKATDKALDNLIEAHPFFADLKNGFNAAIKANEADGSRRPEVHITQIKTPGDLDFILNKVFGGK